jgi:nuclear GTP-binding protein
MSEEYNSEKDKDLVVDNGGVTDEPMYALFKAGQSRRIWGELYKVFTNFF